MSLEGITTTPSRRDVADLEAASKDAMDLNINPAPYLRLLPYNTHIHTSNTAGQPWELYCQWGEEQWKDLDF